MRSLLLSTEDIEPTVGAIAATMAGRPVRTVKSIGRGANSRVFCVETDAGLFALKAYPQPNGSGHDRLGAEVAALEFLARHGVSIVAHPIAADRKAGFALFEWIQGEAVTDPGQSEIEAASDFAARLRELGTATDAGNIAPAAEACFSGAEIAAQIERRRMRLVAATTEHPDLAEFLDGGFSTLFTMALDRAKAGFAEAGWDFNADIKPPIRALSPSDFGFHNAIRRPDGTLAFVDFEYFGWDDPVRLVADFLQHPGMTLTAPLARRFLDRAMATYGIDPNFSRRLDLLFPLIGLRWCMILLNEFLPEGWSRRTFAGPAADRTEVLSRQFMKARQRLALAEKSLNGILHAL